MAQRNADLGEFRTYVTMSSYLDRGETPKCKIEMRMQELSSELRRKANWWTKLEDDSIVGRWREEAGAQDVSQAEFDLVIEKLNFLKSIQTGDIRVAPVDGVYESDERVPLDVRDGLRNAARELENSMQPKDWHPGSDQQVLDLVHPSLFPLINGVSRVVSEDEANLGWKAQLGRGSTITSEEFGVEEEDDDELRGPYYPYRRRRPSNQYISRWFQWLPSEVVVDADGAAKFDSYLNNVHPEEQMGLVRTLEEVLTRFIPMFEMVLTHMKQPWPNLIDVSCDWYAESEPPEVEEQNEPREGEERNEPREDEDDEAEAMYNWYNSRVPIQPSIPESFLVPPEFSDRVNLRGRRLQVITKLANIVLTPSKPSYPGGSWHVEGMKNEHIVASGIYYYESENITESRLSFRQAVQDPDYEQDDRRGVLEIYGMQDDEPLNQPGGDVICSEGRCLCFPNLMQHLVAPFELQDKTLPGVRKILVFFLVDPTITVWSTKRIPPQQMEWHRRESWGALPLPQTVVGLVEDRLDFPLSMEQAKKYRLKLMEERKKFVQMHNERVFERPFSLCEH